MHGLAGLFEDPREARRKQIEKDMGMETLNVNAVVNTLAQFSGNLTADPVNYVQTVPTGFGGYCDAPPVVTSSYAWWPTSWPTVYEDRTAKAFKVVKVLMDKKAIKLTTIKQFVDLVDEIVKVL